MSSTISGTCFWTNTFYGTRICHITGFALKYALIMVGALQLIAYPLARNIIRQNQVIR